MSVIAVNGVPQRWSLVVCFQYMNKCLNKIKGQFEVLNFTADKKNFKTLYIRLSESVDPGMVIDSINQYIFHGRTRLNAVVPDRVPDLPLSTHAVKKGNKPTLKKFQRGRLLLPNQVIQASHHELLLEIQYKYPGLYNLSRKTNHRLLEEIAKVIFDRVKGIMSSYLETRENCFKLCSHYRQYHPHAKDFDLILKTLHEIQDESGAPRLQITEKELLQHPMKPGTIDNIPFDKVKSAYSKYSDKVLKAMTAHIQSLDSKMADGDDEELVAKKKVREEMKKMLPYLPTIVKQIVVKHFTPSQQPMHRIRLQETNLKSTIVQSDKATEIPCDPTSTNRPLGSEPSGVKLATEGEGGAEPQAPLSAADTGAKNNKNAANNNKDAATNHKDAATNIKNAATNHKDAATNHKDAATNNKDAATNNKDSATNHKDAATNNKDAATNNKDAATNNKDAATQGTSSSSAQATVADGPVPAKLGKWKRKRLARKVARAKAAAEAIASNTGDAVLETDSVGNGRGAIAAPSAQTATAATSKQPVGPLNHRQRKERKLKALALMHKVLTDKVEGYVYPVDLTALAPAVRMVTNLSGTPKPPHSETEGVPRVGAGNGQSQHRAPALLVASGPSRDSPPAEPHLPENSQTRSEDTDSAMLNERQCSTTDILSSLSVPLKRTCQRDDAVVAARSELSLSVNGTSSYGATAKSHLKVVIMERNGVHMDEGRATLLRRHLEMSLMALCEDDKYKFEHVAPGIEAMAKPVLGGLSLTAADDYSLEWLTATVASLPPLWPGSSGLVVVAQNKLPKYHRGEVYVPDCDESPEDIRQAIAWCNNRRLPPLRIDQWPIFDHKRVQNETMTDNVMVFGIPVEELSALAARNHRLKYKLANLTVTVRAPETSDVVTPIVTPATVPETPCASAGLPETVSGATIEFYVNPSTAQNRLDEIYTISVVQTNIQHSVTGFASLRRTLEEQPHSIALVQEPYIVQGRIYGEPFLPSKDKMAPFVHRYHAAASRVIRHPRMYNLLLFKIPQHMYAQLMAMDGTTVNGAKLVIRSDIPTYSASDELRSEMSCSLGGPRDDILPLNDDIEDELHKDDDVVMEE